MTRSLPLFVGLFAGLGLMAHSGCGRPATTAEVRGRVSLDGAPLPGGLIRFFSAETATRWSGGTIEADGSYTVPDVPLGRCAVTIDTSNLKNLPVPRRAAPMADGSSPPGTPDASQPLSAYRAIDVKFSAAATTPLGADVKPGRNVLDFQLE